MNEGLPRRLLYKRLGPAAYSIVGYPKILGIVDQMHEASIALAIVDEVCERAASERIERVHTVFVRIGALTAVVPEALQFAWDVATDGTPAAGARLQIDYVPLSLFCAQCSCERTIASGTIPVCPVCGTSSIEIMKGRELFVTAMEVEYAAAIARRSAEHPAQEQHAGT